MLQIETAGVCADNIKTEFFPLTHAQKRICYSDLMYEKSSVSNICIEISFNEHIDTETLNAALNHVVYKNDSLRLRMTSQKTGGNVEIVQYLSPYQKTRFDCFDFSAESPEKMEKWEQEQAAKPFRFENSDLFYFAILQGSEIRSGLLIKTHHAVSDGWTYSVLLDDLKRAIEKIRKGEAPGDEKNPSYLEYADDEKRFLNSDMLTKSRQYWMEKLNPLPDETTIVPLNKKAAGLKSSSLTFAFDSDMRERIHKYCSDSKSSVFKVIMSAMAVYVSRFTAINRISLSSFSHNRTEARQKKMTGMFVGTFPFLIDVKDDMSFNDLNLSVAGELVSVFKSGAGYPFDLLASELRQTSGIDPSYLLNTGIVGHPDMPDIPFSMKYLFSGEAATPLSIHINPCNKDINGVLELVFIYQDELFDEKDIKTVFDSMSNILNKALQAPDKPLSGFSMISDEERKKIVHDSSLPETGFPADETIHSLFEKQVSISPDKTALVYKDYRLTYRELNKKANSLASRLRADSVRTDVIVGILADRSAETIIAMLAVLKAGGAYTPIDPEYPIERIKYIIENSNARLLMGKDYLKDLVDFDGNYVNLDREEYFSGDGQSLDYISNPRDLIYVIYTSGSTGRPKGVMIEHRSVVNYIQWYKNHYGIDTDCPCAAHSSFSFDASVPQIYSPLLAGAELHIIDSEIRLSPAELNDYFEKYNIRHAHFSTQFAEQFMLTVDNHSLKSMAMGGEKLKNYRLQNYSLTDEYGPTEFTVTATYFNLDGIYDKTPIGKPVPNTSVYIVDKFNHPQPSGIPGELCLSGTGLARGYLNRPDLTAEKFVKDPFRENALMYRTGDLARFLPDGNIDFIGRRDFQVKIRGFRIELEEIEQALKQHPSIAQAVVLANKNERGGDYLSGHIILKEVSQKVEIEEIKDFLTRYLPSYMIPSKFGFMEQIPVNANGKIDKNALLETLTKEEVKTEYSAPRNDREKILAGIWESVFRTDRIGIHENFFALGGDSIIGIQMVSRAREAGIGITVKQIYSHPTISSLASIAGSRELISLPQGRVTGTAPLTPIQNWFFEMDLKEKNHFNQSFMLKLNEKMTPELISSSLYIIQEHHDSFNLRYRREENGKWVQYYSEKTEEIGFHIIDLKSIPDNEQETFMERRSSEIQGSLDIENGPVFSSALFENTSDGRQRLMLVIHHLVIDMVSWRIILEDLRSILSAKGADFNLPCKTSSFREWGEALRKFSSSPKLRCQLDYWADAVSKKIEIPYDNNPDHYSIGDMKVVKMELDAEDTSNLIGKVSQAYHTKINDIIVTAFAMALSRWTESPDMILDMESYGREECIPGVDVSRTSGWFTSVHPLALSLPSVPQEMDDRYISESIKSVKEQIRKVPDNGIGFGLIYDNAPAGKGDVIRSAAARPVSFNYLGQLDSSFNEQGILTMAQESAGSMISPDNQGLYPLEIDGFVVFSRLLMKFGYSEKHFHRETVERLAEDYRKCLKLVISHCLKDNQGGFTPSDFPFARLSQQDIDNLTAGKPIEDIYELSPLQEGLMFHALMSPESNQYMTRTYWTMPGTINIPALKKSWEELVENHKILRTSFIWGNLEKPVQMVYKKVDLPWKYVDMRGKSLHEQEARFNKIIEEEGLLIFDFAAPCLMRLHLIQTGDESFRFIWTDHHILVDGWCVPIFLRELAERYEMNCKGKTAEIPAPPDFKNYLQWIRSQDADSSRDFWKDHLRGVHSPTIPQIVKRGKSLDIHKPIEQLQEDVLTLDADFTAKVSDFAKQNQVTVNALIQTAWGGVLHMYSGEQDVLMGTIVSGRPAEIPDIERMTGLLINSLPLKVSFRDTVSSLEIVKGIQDTLQQLNIHGYLSLSEVQELSEIPKGTPLFYTLYVFENYPFDEAASQSSILDIKDIHFIEKTNYPLSLVAFPGRAVSLKAVYDGEIFESSVIRSILNDVKQLLHCIVEKSSEPFSKGIETILKSRFSSLTSYPAGQSYPLSAAQKKYVFREKTARAGVSNNLTQIVEISGTFNPARLSDSIDCLVSRHRILRTCIDTVDGVHCQKVLDKVKYRKNFEDASIEQLESIVEDFVAPFNIHRAPLFRMKLLRIANDRHFLIFDIHRIIADDKTAKILIKELFDSYYLKPLDEIKVSYSDYSSWQNENLSSPLWIKEEKYWMGVAGGEIPSSNLLPDRKIDEVPGSGCHSVILDKELSGRIKKLSAGRDGENPALFISAFNILLSRYSGQQDIIVGYYHDLRSSIDFPEIMGQFENLLPLRSCVSSSDRICDLILKASENIEKLKKNGNFPGDLLYEKLDLKRDAQRDPLFDLTFRYNPAECFKASYRDFTVTARRALYGSSDNLLSFTVNDKPDNIEIEIDYDNRFFHSETILRMEKHLEKILEAVIDDNDSPVGDLDFIPQDEKNLLINVFNDTKRDYPPNLTYSTLFKEAAIEHENREAVVFNDKTLTYQELDDRSAQLACILRDKGVKPDSLVGVMVDPSLEMIIAVIGIIKAGGAFVPIDSAYPVDRINYMLKDSGASVILSKRTILPDLPFDGERVNLDDESIYLGAVPDVEMINRPDNLAYAIYTSGSTGNPKGAMIEHHSLVNLCLWVKDYFELTPEDRFAKYLSFSFDASVMETLPILAAGGAVYIVPEDIRLSIEKVNDFYEARGITLSILPTQFGEKFMELVDNRSLRIVIMGGEQLRTFVKRKYKLINGYGPTEYTVCTSAFEVDRLYDNTPIGKPVFNSRVYILDENRTLKPLGAPGELCIAGEGISRGYINRPDLTADRFTDNPYVEGEKIYRTGDCARWLPDGNLEFLGRIDHQVKIRGYRIELGEIEAVLMQIDSVSESAVTARSDKNGARYLCGYYVSTTDFTEEELKRRMLESLPEYMIPSYLMRLEQMPLTPNGKVDKKKLPEPAASFTESDRISDPAVEKKIEDIIKIWKSVLGLSKIGESDNFFSLGGHSLKAVSIVSRLQKHYEINVADLFRYQTPRELAENISECEDKLGKAIQDMRNYFSSSSCRRSKADTPEYKRQMEEYCNLNRSFDNVDLSKVIDYRNILIAGSTGYRGVYLTREILENKDAYVHLVIRGGTPEKAEEKIRERMNAYFGAGYYEKYRNRISVYHGDLLLDRFGLESAVYDKLVSIVDCIFQCSSYLKHYGNRQDYEQGNILTTKALLDFARESGKADFNLLSTLSVAEGKYRQADKRIFTEYDSIVDEPVDSFYVKTRSEAEKLAVEARNSRLNVNIFRLGLVALDYDLGRLQLNVEDTVFYQKLRAFMNLGVIPDEMDCDPATYVDYAAEAVIRLFDRQNLLNLTHHIINSSPVKLSSVLSNPGTGENRVKLNIRKTGILNFLDFLEENLNRERFRSYIETILLHWGLLDKLSFEELKSLLPEMMMERTNRLLEKLDFTWPDLDASIIRNMLIKTLSDRIDFMKSAPLFKNLHQDTVEELALTSGLQVFPDDLEIIFPGEIISSLYIIQDGNVELSKVGRNGWIGTIRILKSGDFFGVEAIADSISTSILVESVFGDAAILSFKNEDLQYCMEKTPALAIEFIRQMSITINLLTSMLVALG
ncbi:MAG: amino acid adenylation domain-containing protein [Candidatus Xenobiia bacterium LiM19]